MPPDVPSSVEFSPQLSPPSGSLDAPRASRRRRIGRFIAGAAVVLIAVLVLVACNPMTIASWSAKGTLQELLGDRGEVQIHVIERNINVSPRCEITLRMHEDVTSTEFADVLASIDGAVGDSACDVSRAEFSPFSSVAADDWSGASDEEWAVVAERVRRSADISLTRVLSGEWLVNVTARDDEITGGADAFTTAIAGAPLEDALGTTSWNMSWSPGKGSTGGYHGIEVDADRTPPAALGDALAAVALIAEPLRSGGAEVAAASSQSPVAGVHTVVTIVDGVSNVNFRLTVHDWAPEDMAANEAEYLSSSVAASTAQALITAIAESGLEVGSVRVVANDTLRWGDVDD